MQTMILVGLLAVAAVAANADLHTLQAVADTQIQLTVPRNDIAVRSIESKQYEIENEHPFAGISCHDYTGTYTNVTIDSMCYKLYVKDHEYHPEAVGKVCVDIFFDDYKYCLKIKYMTYPKYKFLAITAGASAECKKVPIQVAESFKKPLENATADICLDTIPRDPFSHADGCCGDNVCLVLKAVVTKYADWGIYGSKLVSAPVGEGCEMDDQSDAYVCKKKVECIEPACEPKCLKCTEMCSKTCGMECKTEHCAHECDTKSCALKCIDHCGKDLYCLSSCEDRCRYTCCSCKADCDAKCAPKCALGCEDKCRSGCDECLDYCHTALVPKCQGTCFSESCDKACKADCSACETKECYDKCHLESFTKCIKCAFACGKECTSGCLSHCEPQCETCKIH